MDSSLTSSSAFQATHTIEDSIEKVVRLSAEYDDRLQAAKLDGTHVAQSPWELNPKPTKFPTRKAPEVCDACADWVCAARDLFEPVAFTPIYDDSLRSCTSAL